MDLHIEPRLMGARLESAQPWIDKITEYAASLDDRRCFVYPTALWVVIADGEPLAIVYYEADEESGAVFQSYHHVDNAIQMAIDCFLAYAESVNLPFDGGNTLTKS